MVKKAIPRHGNPANISARFPCATQDMLQFLARAVFDGHGRCVITFDGQVDAERMARAVRLTLA